MDIFALFLISGKSFNVSPAGVMLAVGFFFFFFPIFYFIYLFSFFFNFYFYFILLYITVLVLPYIDMNPPRVYMRSQTWTPLPPPSP